MKKIALKLSILFLITGLSFNAFTQTINIDSTFYSDTEIYPFSGVDSIYGLSITGNITLNSDTSLVRVILVDENYNEYMVYEAYPLITTSMDFDVTDVCDETCYLNGITPSSLIIHLNDASVTLESIIYSTSFVNNADSLRYQEKLVGDSIKVQIMNNNIVSLGMNWTAGYTGLVSKYYSEKKTVLGEKYNLKGLDYYKGGVFEFVINSPCATEDASDLIKHFDWRTRHSANLETTPFFTYKNPGSSWHNPYWDGDPDYLETGNGWITGIRDQKSCGACWAFTSVAIAEAITNLYFNQNIDVTDTLRISERHVLNCSGSDNSCSGGSVNSALNFFIVHGRVNEECYPYESPYWDGFNGQCSGNTIICTDPDRIIKIEDKGSVDYYASVYEIKHALINYGPLGISVAAGYFGSSAHAVLLVGFDYDYEEEHTVWIMKNSWGVGEGDHGYFTMYIPVCDIHNKSYIIPPIYQVGESSTVYDENKCRDEDFDGWYNWGICNSSFSDCPENIPAEFDSDDSNPRIGPYDENYYGEPVAPILKVTDNAGNVIPYNDYYLFYDGNLGQNEEMTLTFKIKNEGNAQLNLKELNNIVISGINEADFIDSDAQDYIIPMKDETTHETSFDITFTLREPIDEPKVAVITIQMDEIDIEDFKFALVFSNCNYDPSPEAIRIDTEWNDWNLKFNDVIVQSGATLTVNGSAAFTRQAGLFIEQGASVIIDGGLLTNMCNDNDLLYNDLWQGVDVWGNSNLTQNEQPNQGLIKLINGGKIEYADIGIETIKYVNGEADYDKTGGVVMINDGTIENCRIGVRFYRYANIHPVTHEVMSNLSFFTKANFITDELFYQLVDNVDPQKQVWLEEVDGIFFKGCSFENNYIKPPFSQNERERGIGLFSLISSFSCKKYDPYPLQGDIIRNSFKGLEYGIKIFSERTAQIANIDSAYFSDNLRGIYLSLDENAIITRNEFQVRDNNSVWGDDDELVGIYTDYWSTAFTIEENEFYTMIDKAQLETKKCLGIVINNSGYDPNEIYNNNFHNLLLGISAQGENRAETGEGLCIKCNDFVDCITDVYVAPRYDGNGNPVSGPTIGIAIEQGTKNVGGSDPTLAAGNTFSEDNTSNVNNYYNDLNCEYVIYTHHEINPSFKLAPDPLFNIDIQEDQSAGYSKDLACPSNLSGGGVIDESQEKSSLSTEYIAVTAYEDTLSAFTDGGNTEALNTDVQSSFPDEAMEVRQQLLNESPYLSNTVMKSTINKENVLPNAMVRDILVANPQSAKTPDVINTLNNRFDPMPDYMMGEIMAGLNTRGAKELLEHKIAFHKTKRRKSLITLERFYKNDTTDPAASNDSLVALWQREPYPGAWYKLSFHYLHKSDSTNLFQTLDSIPVNFNLSLVEEQTHEQYEDLFDVLWDMQADNINPDSTMTQTLLSLANHKSIPGAYAINRLINDSVINYYEPVYLPDLLKSAPVYPENPNKEEKDYIMNIFPNPAGDYFIIEYDLSEYEKSSFILVYDATGRNYKQINLENTHTQKVVSTNGFSYGTYFLQLYIGKELKEVVKLTITK